MEQFREDTSPLLRPHQLEEMQEEKTRLERTLDAPPHVRAQLQDVGSMRRQLRSLNAQLRTQTPRPYEGGTLDAAVKREKELRERFTAGMPTQAEMRKTPTGAVDKHMSWERRNKPGIMEWKNIRLRLQASGAIPDSHADARDVANIERYRPSGGSGELPMHGTLIQGRDFHIPPNVEIKNVASDEDKARWEVERIQTIMKLAESGDPIYMKLLDDIKKAGTSEIRRRPGRPRKEP